MQIERISMTRPHYQEGRPGPVRMIVLHATAGRSPGDLSWLRAGGDERRPVSVHYYIDKRGRIVQLVDDDDTAWHAGQSRWAVDGREVQGCNPVSIGVELENLNSGRDPYPAAQYAAALWLCRHLVERHRVPRSQLVRHLDIAPGRKTDPAGFPWAQFSAEVYTDLAAAAGGAFADRWPLFVRAQGWQLGMPIAMPAGRPALPGGGAAQDDHDRTLRLGEHGRFLVEIYARDLIYVRVDPGSTDLPAPDRIQRLSQAAAGPLRDALLDLLFRQADPLNGFHADWAFHRRFLADAAQLGVPIGPSQRLRGAEREYAYQHFALDSLCSPVGDWQTIYRLSARSHARPGLPAAQAGQLQRRLRDSLYREQAGRQYLPDAALVRYADTRQLGAPIAPPETAEIGEAHYLMMLFASDAIACQLPSADWPFDRPLPAGVDVQRLGATLGAAGGDHALPGQPALLGPDPRRPVVHDLSLSARSAGRRDRGAINLLLLMPVAGPAAADLRLSTQPWHSYITRDGRILRLRDERAPVQIAEEINPQLARLAGRAVVIAVEGEPSDMRQCQRAALIWLIQTLSAKLKIEPSEIRMLSGRRPQLQGGIR